MYIRESFYENIEAAISVTFVGTLSPFFPSFPFNVDLQDARVQNNNYATQHWGERGDIAERGDGGHVL